MVASGPSAANSCLPPSSPVIVSTPPVPLASRGIRCQLDGQVGRINKDKAALCYASGKLVIIRSLDNTPLLPEAHGTLTCLNYRGHAYPVTACKLSPSGAYVASGDERGALRVWAFDHPEHLAKYDAIGLQGAIRDIDWDSESKRLAIGGERLDARAECARAIQWDGVTAGQLMQFAKGRVAAVSFKPTRPFRIVTAGMDEPRCFFHEGPPFRVIPTKDGVPAETSHTRGGVQCVRYNSDGSLLVSVGTDRSICTYDGKTMTFKSKLENIHTATVYSVAWSGDNKQVMTASGDGTCKLFDVSTDGDLKEVHTWKPADHQFGGSFDKVPVGGTQLGCTFVKGDIPVSVGYNGQISVLPKPSGGSIEIITGHYAPIAGMSMDEDRGVFFTGDTNGILCQWDLKTTKATARIVPPQGNPDLMYVVHGTADKPGAISGVAVAPGSGALYSVGWDDNLYVTSALGVVDKDPVPLGAQPVCIATGKDVGCIATVKGLLLVKNGKLSSSMHPITYDAKSVCVSADDKTVYVGGSDAKIHIYTTDGSNLTEQSVIEGKHLKTVSALALSNDGSMLASGDEKDICVFKTSDYSSVIGRGRWCFHLQRITCLSWAPGDQILASGGADDSIYLWSVEKNTKRVHYPYAHRGGLNGLLFLQKAEGMQLLSVGADSVVNRWDVAKDVKEKFV